MTHVEMLYHNNIIYGFKMKGHAGFNPSGPDILCASLSAASQMTVNGILDWIGIDADECIKEMNQAEGLLHFEIPLDEYKNITIYQLFKSFEMYIEQLSEMFKENVKLERRWKDDNSN